MPLVVDVSVMLAWHFPDEQTAKCDSVLEQLRKDQARLPAIWWFELRNVLLVGERRKRAAQNDTDKFLDLIGTLRIHVDGLPNDQVVFNIARRHHLTFYDATYLELALREGIALATLDNDMAKAATAEGIELIGAS